MVKVHHSGPRSVGLGWRDTGAEWREGMGFNVRLHWHCRFLELSKSRRLKAIRYDMLERVLRQYPNLGCLQQHQRELFLESLLYKATRVRLEERRIGELRTLFEDQERHGISKGLAISIKVRRETRHVTQARTEEQRRLSAKKRKREGSQERRGQRRIQAFP
jgi:hypothetical protein